ADKQPADFAEHPDVGAMDLGTGLRIEIANLAEDGHGRMLPDRDLGQHLRLADQVGFDALGDRRAQGGLADDLAMGGDRPQETGRGEILLAAVVIRDAVGRQAHPVGNVPERAASDAEFVESQRRRPENVLALAQVAIGWRLVARDCRRRGPGAPGRASPDRCLHAGLIVVSRGMRRHRAPIAAAQPGAGCRWQATERVSSSGASGGSTSRQMGIATGHRVWKRQPGGGLKALGTSPLTTMRGRSASATGSATGTADNNAWVYGCSGSR